MRRSRLVPLFALVCATLAGVVVEACGNDSAPIGDDPAEGGAGSETSTSGDGGPTGDSSSTSDAGQDGAACPQTVPSLDGGGYCGTIDFGEPAAPFGGVDGGEDFTGGLLPPGIYDAVLAERASGGAGSWRETFVVDGKGNFTRTRQVDTGISDASLGPVTRRSGKYTLLDGGIIRLEPSCAYSGDNAVDAGIDNLPYDVVGDPCVKPSYRYGATGVRITLRRR